MLVEHSIHDAITEPIPIIENSLLDKFEADKSPLKRVLKVLSHTALAGSLGIGLGAGAVAIGAGGMLAIVNAPSFAENEEASQAHTQINNEVSELISDLSGMELRVDCNDERIDANSPEVTEERNFTVYGQVLPYYVGFGEIAPPVMTVRESVCESVTSYNPALFTAGMNSEEHANQFTEALEYTKSVSILLHEAEHNNQVFDEAEATCYSYQKLPGALEKLGMNATAASDIASLSSSIMAGRLLPEYLSDECAPGGELDLKISDVYIGDSPFATTPIKDGGVPLLKQSDPLS